MGWDCSSGCGYNGQDFAWSAGGNGVVQPKYDSVNFLVPQAVAEDVAGKSAAKLLEGFRGAPAADLDRLAEVIAAIGDAALALGDGLETLEVNPLWACGGRIEALDALTVWRPAARDVDPLK